MITLPTRFVCAMLSTLAATGLVVFADPANAVGGASPSAPVIVAAADAPTTIALHG